MMVIDASVLANALGDDGDDGRQARAALGNAVEFVAPDLINVETTAVLRKRWLAGTVTDSRFSLAVDDLKRLDFERVPTLLLTRRAFELRANVSAYDASYVALAEALECELLTGDRRLAGAPGLKCVVRLLSVGPHTI